MCSSSPLKRANTCPPLAIIHGVLLVVTLSKTTTAFNSAFFPSTPTKINVAKTKSDIEIELPDFEELFENIKRVSPLAKMAMDQKEGGFANIQDDESGLKWKTVESNRRKTVHHIEKIDNFQNLGCPIVRFKSSLKGPFIPEFFANIVMSFDERKKWDKQIAAVEEIFPVGDLSGANDIINPKYGRCKKLGVGHSTTKANSLCSPREQLTLCGMQQFEENGASIIWGTEMDDRHDHLLPEGKRHTRARSHLFSAALIPTGPDSFDVEYVLQLDIGGNIPTFLSTPVLVDTIRRLFSQAQIYFNEILNYVTEQQERLEDFCHFNDRKSLLMSL